MISTDPTAGFHIDQSMNQSSLLLTSLWPGSRIAVKYSSCYNRQQKQIKTNNMHNTNAV